MAVVVEVVLPSGGNISGCDPPEPLAVNVDDDDDDDLTLPVAVVVVVVGSGAKFVTDGASDVEVDPILDGKTVLVLVFFFTVPPTAPPTIAPRRSIPATRIMSFPLVVRMNGSFFAELLYVGFSCPLAAVSTSVLGAARAGGVAVADLRPCSSYSRSALYPS